MKPRLFELKNCNRRKIDTKHPSSHHRIKMRPLGSVDEGTFADPECWSRDGKLSSPVPPMDTGGRHLESEIKHSRCDALEKRISSVYDQAKRRCEEAGIDVGD